MKNTFTAVAYKHTQSDEFYTDEPLSTLAEILYPDDSSTDEITLLLKNNNGETLRLCIKAGKRNYVSWDIL